MKIKLDSYEKPTVRLVGKNGNAYHILGTVSDALKKTVGGSPELATQYTEEATSGSYDHLLRVTSEYVNVE